MSRTGKPPTHRRTLDTSHPTRQVGREVFFWFEGKRLMGIAGESIAKALFRNGIRTLSHSVKYGRPRSIHCGRGRCVMCHVEVDGITGVESCLTPLAEGMRIRRQDYKPSFGSLLTRVMRWVPFPAGFYYRMFTRPRVVREAFVGTVRRMAGVGRIDHWTSQRHEIPPPNAFLAKLQRRFDVVVVGAGISGMAAALAAADAGAEVLLVDEYATPGGHAIGHWEDAELLSARDELIRRIEHGASVTVAAGTTAQGFYEPDRLLLGRAGRGGSGGGLKSVSASAFVFATGGSDLIPLFENNDLPGVFGARGLRLFLERDGLVPGRTAVVYGAGRDVVETVGLLRDWNIRVEAVVTVTAGLPLADTRVYPEAKLVRAEGRDWISRAVFEARNGNRLSVPCELLCVAVPGQPAFELASQAGFRYALADSAVSAAPEDAPVCDHAKTMSPLENVVDVEDGPKRFLVGEASGRYEWRSKIEHAAGAGGEAARCAALQ